jgi:hypothetical protein
MLGYIVEKFTDITLKCLKKNAEEFGVDADKVQLLFKLTETDEVKYLMAKENKPLKYLTFLEVLGVRFDLKGYSLYVPKFISGALLRFCDEHKIEKNMVLIMLKKNPMFGLENEDGEKDNQQLIIRLYNGSKYVMPVELINLFDSEDIISEL